MKRIIPTIKILALGIALSFGLSFVYAATTSWRGPTQAAPEGNAFAPINVGPDAQTKDGPLDVRGPLKVTGPVVATGWLRFGALEPSAPCVSQTAGSIGYDAATQSYKYCDGTHVRSIEVAPPPPTLTLTSAATTIALYQSTIINSNSTDAASCRIVGGGLDENIAPGSGVKTVSPTITTTYTVTCLGNDKSSVSQSITIVVVQYQWLYGIGGRGNLGESCYEYLTRLGVQPVNDSNVYYWGSKAFNPTHGCVYYRSGYMTDIEYQWACNQDSGCPASRQTVKYMGIIDYHTKQPDYYAEIGGTGWEVAWIH